MGARNVSRLLGPEPGGTDHVAGYTARDIKAGRKRLHGRNRGFRGNRREIGRPSRGPIAAAGSWRNQERGSSHAKESHGRCPRRSSNGGGGGHCGKSLAWVAGPAG